MNKNFKIGLLVISILFLFLSFYKGTFSKIIYGNKFNTDFSYFQLDSDSIVFSSVLYAKSNSYDGVMKRPIGIYGNNPKIIIDNYKSNISFNQSNNFVNYDSQVGLHGYGYIFIDKISPFSPNINTSIFYAINALLSAIALIIVICWIIKQTNKYVGMGVYLYILFFDIWLIKFAKSVYWVMWTWFIPMIISMIIVEKYKNNKKLNFFLTFFLIYISILLKCLCGFEYISTIMVSMLIPYVYIYFKEKKNSLYILKQIAVSSVAAVAGFVTAILIYLFQYMLYYKSLGYSVNLLKQTIFKRIPGNYSIISDIQLDEATLNIFRKSLKASHIEVISKYLSGYNLMIILLFVLTSIIGIFIMKKYKCSIAIKSNINALLITTWLSMLAPLSWYYLASGHSYIHTHINFVLWSVPFSFFAVSYIIYIVTILLNRNGENYEVR
jgi:hypothetical protein